MAYPRSGNLNNCCLFTDHGCKPRCEICDFQREFFFGGTGDEPRMGGVPHCIAMDMGGNSPAIIKRSLRFRGLWAILVRAAAAAPPKESTGNPQPSGRARYAAGATIQVLLFSVLAVEVKRK